MTQSLSGAALIWRAIFTNGVNKPFLNFILNDLPELGQWLYDLVKPGSALGRFPATDGATKTPDAEFPGMDNPYNELVLQLPENRNVVVSQAQRVALTIVAILKMGRGKMPNRLDDLQLNASLRSDFDANANPPSPTEVTGVYNRSDGILWNFIECCGERRAAEPNTLIENTQSSKAGQKALEQEPRGALWPAAALQTLVTEIPKGSPQRRIIKERLRIFTFGNPSVDWKVKNGTEHPLSKYVNTTEHFANEADFVAMLGVVMHRDD
ncbi:uncharacterized protein NECHADRAFT_88998 [Fusarium vanettenii 77-13-4]|uniref:Uncharacterized protein n=1 Tax=Fusarium vanettenii (strain ATCC MYA-4622 / CBS 123669 / FGSC 9596 / NRRL 45880 / 77-13-4) TaxID=660122 RepID=C7ZPS2_FUSV7|nr:uncharacterized protein NECHADRAFT_88998 [Fusarium vanettenii 77-13-4]EEU33993.1 predicted protein [Fusarium vanettenii 77-13-4]